jgi:hypothetical protein
MDSSDLREREKKLEEVREKVVTESKPVAGIRLDVLDSMIDDLNGSEALKNIFGTPVSRKLAIISESDFGIFETKEVSLSDEKKLVFLKELNSIINKYKIRYA